MCSFFFFNDTATTEIYTLSLHDALPIFTGPHYVDPVPSDPFDGDGDNMLEDHQRWLMQVGVLREAAAEPVPSDRKSTRLNSSHANISYAVFCLKKNTNHDTVYAILLATI